RCRSTRSCSGARSSSCGWTPSSRSMARSACWPTSDAASEISQEDQRAEQPAERVGRAVLALDFGVATASTGAEIADFARNRALGEGARRDQPMEIDAHPPPGPDRGAEPEAQHLPTFEGLEEVDVARL